jgi:adenine-specific DNA-methyltransferase
MKLSMLQEKSISIHNRKYIGSKHRLLGFLTKIIDTAIESIGTFIDGFSGTGVVAQHFATRADCVIANDILYSNYVINRGFLTSSPSNMDLDKIENFICALNQLKPVEGYAYQSYGGTYFSHENAGIIDAIRVEIESYLLSGRCTKQEYYVLLTSLLFAADKVGNTVGQYDAFLKHLGEAAYDDQGRHKVDSNVYKRLQLKVPAIRNSHYCMVFNEDLNDLIRWIEGDVLYLDPPYNNRQYVDCYHVLENIARWNKPPLRGKTMKFERSQLKSLYSQKRRCRSALANLVEAARADHIFLSYNSEGILSHEELMEILESRGRVQFYKESYPVFGNGAGNSEKREIEERLYHCRSM